MKRVFFLIIVALLCNPAFTQAPESFNYQAVVRDETNNPITDQTVSFRISILKGGVSGPEEYIEIHNTSTNSLGLVTLAIGNGIDKVGDISSIDWGADSYYLQVEIDPDGGTDYTLMGTTQLLSVPYAMYSKNAETYSETDPNAVLLNGDQTINGNKTFTGTITVPEPVNESDATTKAYVDKLLSIIQTIQVGVNDLDGNRYKVIIIGDQIWMAENLRTTKYNDGASIPLVTDYTEWSNLTNPGYCWYQNNDNYGYTVGALYNWYAAKSNKLCPTGWHVPTDAEWTTMENYLIANGFNYDGTTTSNKIAKALASTTEWVSSSETGAVGNTDYPSKRNATGFTALPGGYRIWDGTFDHITYYGIWWSATEDDASSAWFRSLSFISSSMVRSYYGKNYGFSVRCIKDE